MCSRGVAPISMLVRLAGASRLGLWHSTCVRSASNSVSTTIAMSMASSNGEITVGSLFGDRGPADGDPKGATAPTKKGGRARRPVKAAALQLASGPDKSANLETATRLILKAKSLGAEVSFLLYHNHIN